MTIAKKGSKLASRFCVAGLIYFEVFLPPEVSEIPQGKERFVDDIGVGLGGALNPASVASALGVDTTVAHPSGRGATDAAVRAGLQRLEISARTWSVEDDPAISLVRSTGGDRGFISRALPGALNDCPSLVDFDWIHVPGLKEAGELHRHLGSARDAGAYVSVAGSWAPERLDELSDYDSSIWDLLILNQAEARRAVTASPESSVGLLPPLRCAASDIIITNGSDPVLAHIDGHLLEVPVRPVERFVDATGAGDAFGAGYIAGRLSGLNARRAIEQAAEVAGIVVGLRGGVVQDPTVFEELQIHS